MAGTLTEHPFKTGAALPETAGGNDSTAALSYSTLLRNRAGSRTNGDIPGRDAERRPIRLSVLFERDLRRGAVPELNGSDAGRYTQEGLCLSEKGRSVKLDKFYALAERKVEYDVKFSGDEIAKFSSSTGDFNVSIDMPNRRVSIATHPTTQKVVDFLRGDREYRIEIYHIYQQALVRITDRKTNQSAEITAKHDGQGGAGKGILQQGFNVGMQWDHYCFGLEGGSRMVVQKITVFALKGKVRLLLYGDSISQPEGYFPSRDFDHAWTQQIIQRLRGDAISSGRGGARIEMLMDYIKNELPYINAEYVMITIGTNGGNTYKKLVELVRFVRSQGSIAILNNIPCNESGTQVKENILIDSVRRELNVPGVYFDLPTSLNGDGKEVDRATMYWEDYSGSYGWQIYHHPNEIGGTKMFQRTLIDLPELYY